MVVPSQVGIEWLTMGGRRETPEGWRRVIRMAQSSHRRAGRVAKKAVGSEDRAKFVGWHQPARRALCIQEIVCNQDHIGWRTSGGQKGAVQRRGH